VQDLDGQITYWNKGAERLFGWTAAEVIGLKVQEFLYRESDEFMDGVAGVLKDGSWNAEVTDKTKAGNEVLVESRWTLLRDDRGKSKSVLSINTDITEKKKLETQFLRAQRLESIGTLAGGIAHDLNNVLGPIIMAVDLSR
jgi:PAS domain S-box-containing protein